MLIFGSLASSLSGSIDELNNDNTAHSIYFYEVRSKSDKSEVGQHYNSSWMSYDDYLWIKENYGDVLSVSFAVPYLFNVYVDEDIVGLYALFVSDEYFRNAYERENLLNFSEQKIILVPDGTDKMRNLNWDIGDVEFQDFLNMAKSDGYTTKPIEDISNGKSDRVYLFTNTWYENIEKDTTPLSSVVIAPMELYNKYVAEKHEYPMPMLSINFYGETDTDVFSRICDHLVKEKDPAGECVYVSPISIFEEHASGQIMLANLLKTISGVAMTITGIGFIGLILVIFNNRKKKLAVALVTGATYFDLYLEIILEIETVILSGVLLGEILGITGLNILDKQVTIFEFGTDIGLAILLPIIYAAIGIIISLAALYNLFKMQPNEILKKE
jgi:ABC-type antimicrobial peptide transport system permease subunit